MIKRLLTTLLLIVILLPPFQVLAQIPGLDQIPAIQQTINAGQSTINAIPKVPVTVPSLEAKETGISIFGITLPFSWNQLAINIGRIVVNQVVNSTVNWMKNGFDGKPAFVTDPKSYFGGLANGITGDYLNQIAPGICSAFSAKIILAIQNPYPGANSYYTPQCTLSEIGVNVANFKNSFTQGGGWDAWFALTQSDDNNPYQIYVSAQGALNNKVTDSINNELKKLDWGNGFKSVSTCKVYNGYPKSPGAPYNPNYGPGDCVEYGDVQTPGATIKSHLDAALPANNYISQIVTADQFDKLLSALAQGVLQKFAFKNGGLLGSSSGNGSNADGTVDTYNVSGNSNSLSCSPSPDQATVNETEVTWILSSGFGSTIKADYTWAGEGVDRKTGYTATSTYVTAGNKTASVTAVTSKINELGEIVPGSQTTRTVPCSKPVVVSKYRPLSVSCSAAGPLTAFWSTQVDWPTPSGGEVWEANITGGSGGFTGIEWSGSQDVVPGTNGGSNVIWPNRYGAPNAVDKVTKSGNIIDILHHFDFRQSTRWNNGGGNSLEKIVQTQDATGGFITKVSLTRPYYKDGKNTDVMGASITVTDQDLALPTVTVQCSPSYTLIDK